MSGHYRMQRGWMEHKFFGREPFTRAQAWCWLIEKAAWKDRNQPVGNDYVSVRRSEYATSVRFLAERWQWSKSRVQRFLAGLESEGMAERVVIATCSKTGTASGTALTVIRICNYDEYQASADESGTPGGTAAGQQRDSSGTKDKKGKKGKEPKKEKEYAFTGKIIRLNQADLDRWQTTYKNIPNLCALLESRDAWLAEQPEKVQRKWFQSTAAYLATEGEMDALALIEAGILVEQVLSVPNGAPARSSDEPEETDRYRFVEAALKEGLGRLKKFILVTDNDAPGLALRQDLVRLLGPARCWFVDFPAGVKDVNDFLIQHGPEDLKIYIEEDAKEWPVTGLYRIGDIPEPAPLEIWRPGFLEWESKLAFAPTTVSVVTGQPNHGKTTLMMQLWYLRLLENIGELTFFHVPNGGGRSRTEAGIFKGLGVRAGVPDLVLLFPDGRCAFIELKAEGGRLSAAQTAFKNQVEGFGFPFAECRAVDEVERFVRGLIANPDNRKGPA